MFVPTTTHAAAQPTHALRVGADGRKADGECKKYNCGCATTFHLRTRNWLRANRVQLGQSIGQIVDRIYPSQFPHSAIGSTAR